MDLQEVLKVALIKNGKQLGIDLVSEALPLALDEAKKLIPGGIDDAIIEMLKPILKEQLIKLLEKVA